MGLTRPHDALPSGEASRIRAWGSLTATQAALIGVAGNAPTYSIAVSAAALVAVAGAGAPLAILLCALVTLGIVLAYARLNAEQPNAGAAYAWVGTILHPAAGFFAGWCVLLSGLIFMMSATLPAAKATLLIVAPALVEHKPIVVAVAAFWLILVTAIVARGTELLARVQSSMTLLELGLMAVIVASVFANAEEPSLNALLGGASAEQWSPTLLAKGLVIAIFIFWGWDVIFNLAEETHAPERASARAGFFALTVLTVIFVFFTALIAAALPPGELQAGAGNAIFALADKLLPKPISYIAVLTFLLSVIGGIEASIVSFSRTVLANARDGRLPAWLGRLDDVGQTPKSAVFLGAGIVLVLMLAAAAVETVDDAITASINATGIIVAAYYALAALACAVFFLRKRERNAVRIAIYVVWPLASAVIFVLAAAVTLFDLSALALSILLAGLALGGVIFYARSNAQPVQTKQASKMR